LFSSSLLACWVLLFFRHDFNRHCVNLILLDFARHSFHRALSEISCCPALSTFWIRQSFSFSAYVYSIWSQQQHLSTHRLFLRFRYCIAAAATPSNSSLPSAPRGDFAAVYISSRACFPLFWVLGFWSLLGIAWPPLVRRSPK
jgi:hypothetical protein